MNEHELQLLEGINVTMHLMRHEQQRQGSESARLGVRMSAVEDRQRKLDSIAPRALRAVSESVQEHDSEMAASAVYMDEMHARLARIEDAQATNAKASKVSRQKIAATMTVAIPLLVRIFDWVVTARGH